MSTKFLVSSVQFQTAPADFGFRVSDHRAFSIQNSFPFHPSDFILSPHTTKMLTIFNHLTFFAIIRSKTRFSHAARVDILQNPNCQSSAN